MNLTIAWTWRGCLTHIGADIERLIGRTAEEIIEPDCSMEEIVTPESLSLLQDVCCAGPPGGIEVRALPLHLRRKDGREVCARLVAVCRYDGDGGLAEAWGSLHACQRQNDLNNLLFLWPRAVPADLVAIAYLADACA